MTLQISLQAHRIERASAIGPFVIDEKRRLIRREIAGEFAKRALPVRVEQIVLRAQLPVDVATYLMNEKREWLHNIETRGGVQIVLIPNKYIETPA